jgi:signal transduction histidine kinase
MEKFILLYFIGIVGVIWIVVSIRTYKIKTEKLRLDELIHEKIKDIENQKEEIQSQADRLQEVYNTLLEHSKFKEGLTSMIVHDLKNPLNSILNVPRDLSSDKQLIRIRQSGKHMLNLVMNILDVYKYQKAKMELEIKESSLFDILNQALDQVSYLAYQKNISLRVKIIEDFILEVDPEILVRVFINLLTNAIKYTPVNGYVIIDSIMDASSGLCIRVIDSGPGIPKEKEALVFSEFGQIIAKKAGDVRSTGLGLTFCKIAVEAHDGSIGFDNNKTGGTIFWFTVKSDRIKSSFKNVDKISNLSSEDQYINLLSKYDIDYLTNFIPQLKESEIYSISRIRSILDGIEEKSKGIQIWKEKIIDASYSHNEALYFDLLELEKLL